MSWTLIEHQALTSSVASVTLGSGGTIPQTYKTLKLVISCRSDNTNVGDQINLKLNNATANFTYRLLQGDGASAASYSGTVNRTFTVNGNNATSSTFGNMEITLPNYAGSTNKPVSIDAVSETNATGTFQNLQAMLWSDTTAITSIVMTPFAGTNLLSGSTFTLYGLA